MGLPPIKGPQKDSDKINSEIRANLIFIKKLATEQVSQKYEKSRGYDEERQQLFQQIIYGELIGRR